MCPLFALMSLPTRSKHHPKFRANYSIAFLYYFITFICLHKYNHWGLPMFWIFYIWNHIVCIILVYFCLSALCYVFEIHACWWMHLLSLLYNIFLCMKIPQFIYLFYHWQNFVGFIFSISVATSIRLHDS